MAARSSTGPSTPKKEEICKALFRSPDWNQDEIVGSKTQKSSGKAHLELNVQARLCDLILPSGGR